ncbi:MAG: DUF4012 domain-containing protein [Candidatus Moraniibacteriota bacterium]
MFSLITQHRKLSFFVAFLLILGVSGYFLLPGFLKSNSTEIARTSMAIIKNVSKILPIEADTKKEIDAIGTLVSKFTETDGKIHSFFIMLQNNYELRPGGGFLGQYGILKIKDGQILSFVVEDANLLDQRIKDANIKITPPWPLTRYGQVRRWLLHDSNFSPDFPTNAAKAEYFYRLGGGREKFDGVFAINADVLNHVIGITGPITIPGFGTYTSENAAIMLEEDVEKDFLGEDVPAELKQNRKNVMKRLAAEIVRHISSLNDVKKIADLGLEELRNKNIQLFFKDAELQNVVAGVYWDGSVAKDWGGDFLMVVDANIGAKKSDYYVKRSLDYVVDFTGTKGVATLTYHYNHTATYGDWRTSDYHTYTRVFAPTGSKYIEGSRQKTGGVSTANDTTFKKTIFSYKVDALMNQTLPTSIQYELPETITADNYQLLIQKQSGTGDIPVKVTLKTTEGEFSQEATLKKDIRFSFAKAQ